MLRFGDFYKVGVAGAGNFDQRLFWHSWGERYHGLLEGDNYLPQAALTYADQLQGDLLFIHGLLDHGVHPGGLFQLTQALMDANKKFELVSDAQGRARVARLRHGPHVGFLREAPGRQDASAGLLDQVIDRVHERENGGDGGRSVGTMTT